MLKALTARIPLKVALPLLISVLVLTSVTVLILFLNFRTDRVVLTLAEQNIGQIHERISERLNDFLSVAERTSEVNRGLFRDAESVDFRRLGHLFYEQVRGIGTITSIVWGSEDGRAVYVSRHPHDGVLRLGIRETGTGSPAREYRIDGNGGVSDVQDGAYEYDPRTRPWYQAAVAAGNPDWAAVYAWTPGAGDDPVLSLAWVRPVRNDSGDLLGVLNVEISLRDLSRFLETLEIGKTGIAYVVDDRGLLVATSSSTPIADPASGARYPAQDSSDPLITASAHRLMTDVNARGLPAGRVVEQLRADARDVILIATPFERSENLRWTIATLVPVADFLGEIRSGRHEAALIAGGIVAIALVLGILLALYVARPIVELTRHLRRIGHGKLDDAIFLEEFPEFMRLSMAINQMVEDLRERLKLRESLAMATEVQQRLLPSTEIRFSGVDIAARSYYCDETGGDYYDYLRLGGLPPETAVIAIGDVSGHGIASAMVMASARAVLRSRCHDARSLSELLEHMNVQITEDSTGGRFMTMQLVAIDPPRRELRWASAGHREPLILDPDSGEFVDISGAGIPLGVTEDTRYQEYTFTGLCPGHLILLATDGLWEAANSTGAEFGLDRLRRILHENAAQEANQICTSITMALLSFFGGEPQSDDISFVLVKVTGDHAAPPATATGQGGN